MATLRTAVLTCVLLGLATTPGRAAKFASEQDPTAVFAGYRTVSWSEGTPASIARAQGWIDSAIEQELTGRGLTIVETDADLFVVSYSLVDQHTLEDLADETQWEFWTGVRSVRAADLGVGTLVVDLVDPGTEKVIWRGLASGAVSGTVEKNRKKVDKIVRKLFRLCPLGAE